MSRSNTEKEVPSSSCAPLAPPSLAEGRPFYQDDFASRAPPPTYEESQRPQNVALPGHASRHVPPPVYPPVTNNQFYGMTHHQQLPTSVHMQGYSTQGRPMQQISNYSVFNANVSNARSVTQPNVITIDPMAEVRRTVTGAVIVPPPPPGCSPTPAQLAAMQGQPVVVKQNKRSFF